MVDGWVLWCGMCGVVWYGVLSSFLCWHSFVGVCGEGEGEDESEVGRNARTRYDVDHANGEF